MYDLMMHSSWTHNVKIPDTPVLILSQTQTIGLRDMKCNLSKARISTNANNAMTKKPVRRFKKGRVEIYVESGIANQEAGIAARASVLPLARCAVFWPPSSGSAATCPSGSVLVGAFGNATGPCACCCKDASSSSTSSSSWFDKCPASIWLISYIVITCISKECSQRG